MTSFLDSDALLRALDAGTAALPPGAAITAASWPGLAVALIKHIEAELARSAAGKKGPEPALSRAFRLLTARAEEGERRSGHARMLLRAAARLFKHVTGVRTAAASCMHAACHSRHNPVASSCWLGTVMLLLPARSCARSASLPGMPPWPHTPSPPHRVPQVLKTVGLTSPMGLDYSHVLRNQLLPVPEYCACSSAHAFQGEGNCTTGRRQPVCGAVQRIARQQRRMLHRSCMQHADLAACYISPASNQSSPSCHLHPVLLTPSASTRPD